MSQVHSDRRLRNMCCAAVAVVVLVGCTPGVGGSVGPPKVSVPSDQQDLVGPWRDAQGREVPDGTNDSGGVLVLSAGSGSTSCTTDNVTVFMELAWPAGRRLDWKAGYEPGDTQRYVRQTEGSVIATDGQSDLDSTLPVNARSTGLNKDGNTLYVISSKPSAIWVKRADGHIERWARLAEGAGCA